MLTTMHEITVKVLDESGQRHTGKAAITNAGDAVAVLRIAANMIESEHLSGTILNVKIVEQATDRGFIWR